MDYSHPTHDPVLGMMPEPSALVGAPKVLNGKHSQLDQLPHQERCWPKYHPSNHTIYMYGLLKGPAPQTCHTTEATVEDPESGIRGDVRAYSSHGGGIRLDVIVLPPSVSSAVLSPYHQHSALDGMM